MSGPTSGPPTAARAAGAGLEQVAPGLARLALRTPTLPPATHTNSYVVGTGELAFVEPASPYDEEVARALDAVERLGAEGLKPKVLLLTHHHADHVGGAMRMREALGVPLLAHRATADRLEGQITLDGTLDEGDRVELQGPTPMTLEALHTPGHAPGHLCFREPSSGAMIVGDMVASVGTILIEPTDGDMAVYLDSLARLREIAPSMLLPAHGDPIHDPEAVLSHYIDHRLARERKVRAALDAHGGPAEPEDLVPAAYADTPEAAWPLAAMSLHAHLIKLERDGLAARRQGAWVPCGARGA